MKTKLLIIITGILTVTAMMMFAFDDEYNSSANNAYGMWFPLSPEALIEESKTVFVGTITAIAPVDVEYQSQIAKDGTRKDSVVPEVMTLEEYTVSVEEYLKNPQNSDTMKVLSATVGGVPSGPARISGFEIGDRVLFYLPKDEGQTHFANQYLPESFKIPKHCDAESVLKAPKIIGANDFRIMQDGITIKNNFTENKKMQFVFDKDLRTLNGSGFTVDVAISKILDKNELKTIFKESIHAKSQPCEWIATVQWNIIPTAGDYTMRMSYGEDGDTGYSTGSSGFSVVEDFSVETPLNQYYSDDTLVISPLKQFKSGITVDEIQCKESLTLVTKYNGSPVCVKPETKTKLIEIGWAIHPDTYGVKSVFELVKNDTIFDVEYVIKGGIITNMIHSDKTTLIITIDSSNDGQVTLHIPHGIIDPIPKDSGDNWLFVLVNGEEVESEQITDDELNRTVSLKFNHPDPEIELIASWWI